MPSSNTATRTTPAPLDAPTVGVFHRTTARLRAHWLHHRGVADVALGATLLLLATAALTAAR